MVPSASDSSRRAVARTCLTIVLAAGEGIRMRSAVGKGAAVAALGFRAADPAGYGRLLVEAGQLVAIREDKDASPEERKLAFCNAGLMALDGRYALKILEAVDDRNAKREYY